MFVGNKVLYPMRSMTSAGPVASQATTVSTVAVAATGYTADPATDGVQLVTLDIQGSDVRVRWDGTDPTSTSGHILPASTAYTWNVQQYNSAKWIRDSAATSDATVFASPMAL